MNSRIGMACRLADSDALRGPLLDRRAEHLAREPREQVLECRRLLRELEREATARDLRVVRLDTHEVLTEAIAMYRASGYHEIPRYDDSPYAYHWFEKALVELDGYP